MGTNRDHSRSDHQKQMVRFQMFGNSNIKYRTSSVIEFEIQDHKFDIVYFTTWRIGGDHQQRERLLDGLKPNTQTKLKDIEHYIDNYLRKDETGQTLKTLTELPCIVFCQSNKFKRERTN